MTVSCKIEHELEKSEESKNSISNKSNLKGDWLNLFVLTILYALHGFSFGFSMALPIIFQNKKNVTYNDQGSFSFVIWPYSIKLLWAPVVDALYSQWMGRRKSWIIPVQYIIGTLFIYFALNFDDWLPESGKPNLKMIVCVMLIINIMSATQDIALDGWALTLLKKNNVNYGSMCNTSGISVGMFFGSVFPILLSSDDFCNKYLSISPDIGGIANIKNFLFCCGIIYLVITTLIGIFKVESDEILKKEHTEIDIFQNYKLLWDVLKLPSMRIFIIVVLTSTIGFITTDSIVILKLIDAGVSKDDIMIIHTIMYVLKAFLPFVIAKYTSGSKPISLYLKLTPIRLLWSLTFAVLIYYTPLLLMNNGVVNVPLYYYCIIGLIFAINEVLSHIMLIVMISFFTQISDTRCGGTYMTLLKTVRNLGWSISYTIAIIMVDNLSFNWCFNDVQNNCLTENLKNICSENDGSCVMFVDGYYVEVIICLIIGFVWYAIFKGILKNLQSKNSSHWMVDLN